MGRNRNNEASQNRTASILAHQYAGRKTGGCWIDQKEFNAFCKEHLVDDY